MSHHLACWANVVVRVKEGRDFLWRTTNEDHNPDHRRRNAAVRQYAKSTDLNSTPKSARRAARLSKRNAAPSSTPRLARRAANRPNGSKARSLIPELAKKAANGAKPNLLSKNEL